ncbi:MAG: zinc ribbon domain-containing protein [Catenulispora sp.]|nr:zinc ribbon domain-containing protein [Catenulispora sp.]
MIVWGWRTVFRVVGSGVFSCPSCGADRNYERRRAQRFFTLFFIPLIPLKTIGEFIRCTYCKTDYRESVLGRPTAAQFTDLLQNTVRGVMVNVLRRGGAGHPAARAIAVEEIVASGAIGYSENDLAQDMQVVPEDLTQMLAGLAGQLPEAGREALVRGAVRVAAADGPADAGERAVIDVVGAALGMTQAHVAGVVASVPGAGHQSAHPGATASYDPFNGMPSASMPGTGAQAAQQAPTGFQPVPGQYGAVQDAVPPRFDQGMTHVDPSSSMETMVIPPRPAPAQPPAPPNPTPVHDSSGMETMMLPPKPAAPAPDISADSAASAASSTPTDSAPENSGYQDIPTVAISAPVAPVPAPPPPVAAPVAPAPDPLSDSSAMETMVVPINRALPQDSGDEPTHVTDTHREPWPPTQR